MKSMVMPRGLLAAMLVSACLANAKLNTEGPHGPPYVLVGDIQVPVEDFQREADPLGASPNLGKSRLWAGGSVRYAIATDYTNAENPAAFLSNDDARISWAVAHLEEKTCIRMSKCASPATCEQPFIVFVSHASSCSSYIGNIGSVNTIHIPSWCSRGSVVHEIYHSLGVHHEQVRFDRDEYVTVNTNNIDPDAMGNFNKMAASSHDLGAYNYGSIMHYDNYGFSINGQQTIESPQPIGQRSGLSAGDIATIDFLYNGCSAVFAAPVCMTNRDELETYEINIYQDFQCQFNVEWTAGQYVYVNYSLTTAPESSMTFPPRNLMTDSNSRRVLFKPSVLDVDKVYTVAATFTAATNAALSTTCSTTVKTVRGPLPPPVAFIPSGVGIHTAMYRGTLVLDFPDFDSITSVQNWTGIVDFTFAEWSNLGYDDDFASRHTGYLTINVPGDHTFYLTSDDGSRMFLDGVLIIDNGGIHGSVTETSTKYLVPGKYEVRVEYFEARGGNTLKWEWKQPGAAEQEVVPLERLDPLFCPTIDALGRCQAPSIVFISSGRVGVHTATYRAATGTSMQNFPTFDTTNPVDFWTGIVDFNTTAWSNLGYNDNFASRHTGYLTVNVGGYHTFYLTSDDGSRMFLDGVLIIDNGGLHSSATKTATTLLVPRQYEVRIEYFEYGGAQILKWEWKQPGAAEKEAVPLERLDPLYCQTTDDAGRCEAPSIVFIPSGTGILTETYRAATGTSMQNFPVFDNTNPVDFWTGIVDFNTNQWSNLGYDDNFASRHTGYLTVNVEGYHMFYLTSDDGSRMFLDGVLIIDNGGLHGSVTETATRLLVPRKYEVRIEYFEYGGAQILKWEWKQPGEAEKVVVPLERLVPLYCPTTDDTGRCQALSTGAPATDN
ncbi:Astacin [Diplonema papillatum]|nr:Astacin [Diplonema papillatum]